MLESIKPICRRSFKRCYVKERNFLLETFLVLQILAFSAKLYIRKIFQNWSYVKVYARKRFKIDYPWKLMYWKFVKVGYPRKYMSTEFKNSLSTKSFCPFNDTEAFNVQIFHCILKWRIQGNCNTCLWIDKKQMTLKETALSKPKFATAWTFFEVKIEIKNDQL